MAQKIGVFDLMSFFWTLAGARSKEEGAAGLALQVLRYMRDAAEQAKLGAVCFGADGPGPSFRTRHCPGYKGDRKPKDEAQRAELGDLYGALVESGFTVVQETESTDEKREPPDFWFEGDDACASLARKVADGGDDALIFSNDWDLAQVLADDGEGVRLYTTRGDARKAADVEREFGVPPSKLGDLKALAGDSGDHYKPFPGSLLALDGDGGGKTRMGVGEKSAADLLKKFGSAAAALAAATSNLDDQFREAGIPPRVPKLLRAGGAKALEVGRACAHLRYDVPVPDALDVGDWEEAEAALRERLAGQQAEERAKKLSTPAVERVQHDGASEGRVSGPATDPGLPPPKPTEEDSRRMSREHLAKQPPADLATMEAMLPPIRTVLGVDYGRPGGDCTSRVTMRVDAAGLVTVDSVETESRLSVPERDVRVGEYDGDDAVPDVLGRGARPGKLPVSRGGPVDCEGGEDDETESRLSVSCFGAAYLHGPAQDPAELEGSRSGLPGSRSAPDHSGCRHPTVCRVPTLANPDGRNDHPLEPRRVGGDETQLVLLTREEFLALAPMPALVAVKLLARPPVADWPLLLMAISGGAFDSTADGSAFVRRVDPRVAAVLREVAACAKAICQGLPIDEEWRPFAESLKGIPTAPAALRGYGRPLARS